MDKEQIPQPADRDREEEGRLWQEVQATMDEKDRLMAEINKVFESAPDRMEAEKIILEKYASQMGEASEKSGKALRAWIESMKRNHEKKKIE